MSIFAALTLVSGNAKTGPIPTSMTGANTCPKSCPLNRESGGKGCYASGGPAAMHWRKVTNGERGKSWAEFCADVAKLPKGQLWRHNVAGDLPTLDGVEIDGEGLRLLTKANKGKKGFTYTHFAPEAGNNAQLIKQANDAGLTVNLSANNVREVAPLLALNIAPVVCILPMEAPNVQSVEGVKIVACPAEKSDRITCANCGLCAEQSRDYVIGFRAHGVSKKHVDIIAKG